ncbi:hypothetical protein GGH94_004653 [Coemansia aciculifera]|uniref:Uncharacterized protein n=1 Tax=Coemansia aciculifera TaxID=417176 RepID=A0A9W8IEW9_9FUNG|nr:hypothetical protein GGH94_004653 [Coemansia aciculifera]KAJ2871721.1 hypothetical protein GGH93_004586 [Coemansia aciculifera]
MNADAEWRALYRRIVRAVPRITLGKRTPTAIAMAKVRQGFQMKRDHQLSESERARLYRQGWNTLGFLKLARELGSVERGVVSAILRVHRERSAAEEKPGTKRRRLQPQQVQAYDSSYNNYDEAIANIALDLDIVLPQDTLTRSLEWIPLLKRLHKGDPALENTDPITEDV